MTEEEELRDLEELRQLKEEVKRIQEKFKQNLSQLPLKVKADLIIRLYKELNRIPQLLYELNKENEDTVKGEQ